MRKRHIIFWFLCFSSIITLLYHKYLHTPVLKDQVLIGTTYMTMNNNFYRAINDEVEKVVDGKNDKLIVRDPALDSKKQAQQIYDLASQGCQVLIINPVEADSDIINQALRDVKAMGMKIIVVDSELKDDTLADCTIVSDNYDAGVQCAKDLMRSVDHADILLLEHATAMSAVDRITGFTDTIKGHPAYRIVDRCDTQGQTELTLTRTSEVIQSGTKFDVIMALNDPSALGALAAIKKHNLKNNILVYGVDGSPDVKKLIASSQEIKGTSAQTPMTMGQKAVEIAYLLLDEDHQIDAKIITPVHMITKENIADYDVSGWQ